jgi:type IVB pilus formation R64 PilN family outer membrane protein
MIKNTCDRRRILFSNSRLVVVTLLTGYFLILGACQDRPTEKDIDQTSQKAGQSLNSVAAQNPPVHYNPLVVTDKLWTGSTALRMQRGVPLPARYETSRGITLVAADPLSLSDIANAITNQTGIAVRVNQSSTGSAPAASNASPSMPVAYEGPLSGLLERVAGHFGVNWNYNGATIEVSRYETRVFVIEALPGTEKIEEGMQDNSTASSGSGGGGASGASTGNQQNTMTQNSKTSIDIKYWDELGQTLTSMLGGVGTAIVSPSLGTVTITTTPEVMHNIGQYIEQENQRLSRQIAIDVAIYAVSLNEGITFDIAFSTALHKIAHAFLGNITGLAAPAVPANGFSGGGTISAAILNPRDPTESNLTDVVTALSAVGNTATIAKFPLITLNNRPVSRRVGEQIGYVASSSTTVAGTSGTPTTALTPGAVSEGFSVQLTPRLLDDGRILLEYSLSDIDPPTFQTFNSQCGNITGGAGSCSTSGSSSIQVPTSLQRIFVQQSVLKSGSTLIMGGAEEEDLAQNKQGVGSPDFYGLGGGISSARTHTMIFFVVTPQVLDVPHTEQE